MKPNIIITDPSRNLRALGRNALSSKWTLAVITTIVYLICLNVPPVILNAVFGVNIADLYGNDIMYSMRSDTYNAIYSSMPEYSVLAGLYTIVVTGAFTLGITLFFLAMFRKQKVNTGDLFLGFEKFGKALGLMLFQSLFVFLWSLLLIVPGIIASIRYSQAFFILADDPSKGIRQCMDESKAMMNGNKMKYFCMNFSFIGWLILSVLPASVLSGIASSAGLTGVAAEIISIIGALFMAPVSAYIYSTRSGFYEILAGHLIKETQPAPVTREALQAAALHDEHRDDM